MKLSTPKPTSEMLPARTPAKTATKPSRAFHATVKYSSLRPRRTNAVRSKMAVPSISAVYNVVEPRRGWTCRNLAVMTTDSPTLQALLAEVRQLRKDLQTTAAGQTAQILLYRLQTQEASGANVSS